jgi:hypothetical protein
LTGFPNAIERVALGFGVDALGAPGVLLFDEWTRSESADLRAVGRRLLVAARAPLDEQELVEVLTGSEDARDRFSAAECLVRSGASVPPEAVLHELSAAFARDSAMGLVEPRDAPRSIAMRLEWALGGAASVVYAPLLPLIASRFAYDSEIGVLHDESQRVADLIVRLMDRWGDPGAIAVLALVDRGEIVDDWTITHALEERALLDASFATAVRSRAELNGRASRAIIASVDARNAQRDLAGLYADLATHVMPASWTQEQARACATRSTR